MFETFNDYLQNQFLDKLAFLKNIEISLAKMFTKYRTYLVGFLELKYLQNIGGGLEPIPQSGGVNFTNVPIVVFSGEP